MIADADLQVWLEMTAARAPAIVVPYVQSTADDVVRYQMRAVSQGRNGRSEISQGGSVVLHAGRPMPLGQMSLTVRQGDECKIVLILKGRDDTSKQFEFDCPNSIVAYRN